MEELYQKYLEAGAISTDTRQLTGGELFFALKGENYDANDYVDEALQAGASYVVTQNKDYLGHRNCYYCEDTLKTLQELAAYHRQKLSIPVIAITGTNGKTTTKELCRTSLSCAGKTFATMGNLNNHIGVPLSLLSVDQSYDYAIIEMGANHIGEIEALCRIADPDFGLITNIGKAHLEGFGSFDGVVQTKTELYRHIESKNGSVFVNEDDSVLLYESEKLKRVFYGKEKFGVSEFPDEVFLKFSWKYNDDAYDLQSKLTGAYNLPNFLAAICLGLYFGAEPEEINLALSGYTPVNKRSQIQKTERNTLVVDAYNANPSSMALALDNFVKIKADKKILVLGDMLELGKESRIEHEQIMKKAVALKADLTVFIGSEFGSLAADIPNVEYFDNVDKAAEFLSEIHISNALVLIKGSRGIRCENVIPVL